jgi:4-hydroxy-3-polyprenylbenzoate decarboxylase
VPVPNDLIQGEISDLPLVTGIVMPPAPASYAKPQSVEEIVDHTVGRALDLFDIDTPSVRRWGGTVTRTDAAVEADGS